MKKKPIKFIVSLLAIVLLIIPTVKPVAVNFDPYMQTQSYSTYISVFQNHTFKVTETIKVNFLTERHGIYRYIPYIYEFKDKDGNITKSRIKITDIDVDGDMFESYKENGNQVIQIGDPDSTISGTKTYTISYTVKCQDDGNSQYDEFCYNVLPHGWQTEIDEAYVTVSFEGSPDLQKYSVFSGEVGSTNSEKFSSRVQGNVIFIDSEDALSVGEGATLSVTLPDDYFSGEEQNSLLENILLILSAICLCLVLLLKAIFGKKQQIIPVVNFYPPEDMTSADIGYVLDGFVDTKDIVSLIIYWADKGYLTITETEGGDTVLSKIRQIDENAKPYEKIMFNELFKNRDSVAISDLKEKFYIEINTAKSGIANHFSLSKNRKIFKGSSVFAGILSMILSSLPFLLLCCIGYSIKIVTEGVIAGGILSALLSLALLSALTVLNYKKNAMKKISYIAGKTVSIIGLGIVYAISVLLGLFVLKMPVLTVVCLICAAVGGFFSIDMRSLTDRGIKLTGDILGFKEFIETAELDRLNALVSENPQYFYRVLPFAYVMGLSEKWSKKFETIATPPPVWYNGYNDSAFNTYLFIRSFSNSMNNIQKEMISTPQAKDSGGVGFGGGGFSGGGIGGGGGGSW